MNFQCWQFGHGKNPRVGQTALGLEKIVRKEWVTSLMECRTCEEDSDVF